MKGWASSPQGSVCAVCAVLHQMPLTPYLLQPLYARSPHPLQAGAAEKGVPLYKHIADLAGNTKLILPVRPAASPASRAASRAAFQGRLRE